MKSLYVFFFSSLGFFSTYYLIELEVNSIFASSLVGLLGSFLCSNKHFNHNEIMNLIYCSSFAAIGAREIFHHSLEFLFLILLISTTFISSKKIFKGYGGKLGTIAFITTMIAGSFLSFFH